MLELRDVSFSYAAGARPVMEHVDLTLDEGELVLVAGRTGVGKSTLLGVFNGLVPTFTGGRLTGDVLLDGASILHLPPRDRADVVGYVGQDPTAGFVTDTVEEELAYGMEQLGLDGATMRRRVEETLDLLGIADLRGRDLRTLSGGQQQRVAIGSVLTMHPRLLVLDEPTSALDPTAAEDVLATLTRLVHDLGVTVVLAEHRLERVVPFADRIALVGGDGGVVVGEPAEILRHSPVAPPIVELGRWAGWTPLPLSVRDARRQASRLALVPPGASPVPEGAPALVARRLTVAYGRQVAVREVDLTLRTGQVTALMGRNGSGKSTLIWALQGARSRSGGSVVVDGADTAQLSPEARRHRVGLVPQTAADLLYLETVAEECAAADRDAGATQGSAALGVADGQRHVAGEQSHVVFVELEGALGGAARHQCLGLRRSDRRLRSGSSAMRSRNKTLGIVVERHAHRAQRETVTIGRQRAALLVLEQRERRIRRRRGQDQDPRLREPVARAVGHASSAGAGAPARAPRRRARK